MNCIICGKKINLGTKNRVAEIIGGNDMIEYGHWTCIRNQPNLMEDAKGIIRTKERREWKDLNEKEKKNAKALKTKIQKENLNIGKRKNGGSKSGMAASAYGF